MRSRSSPRAPNPHPWCLEAPASVRRPRLGAGPRAPPTAYRPCRQTTRARSEGPSREVADDAAVRRADAGRSPGTQPGRRHLAAVAPIHLGDHALLDGQVHDLALDVGDHRRGNVDAAPPSGRCEEVVLAHLANRAHAAPIIADHHPARLEVCHSHSVLALLAPRSATLACILGRCSGDPVSTSWRTPLGSRPHPRSRCSSGQPAGTIVSSARRRRQPQADGMDDGTAPDESPCGFDRRGYFVLRSMVGAERFERSTS